MGAYLSAREAADYCGVSEKTIRNWLAAGRLSADKSAGSFRIPQGQLDALRRHDPRSPQGADRQPEGSAEDVRAEGPHSVPVADVLALLRNAQAEAIAKAEAAAMWQTRAEVLALQLDQARGELRALTSPDRQEGPPAPDLTAQTEDPMSETSTPWWRRCWAWAMAAL